MGRAAQRGLEQLTAELEEARRRIAELEAEQAAAAFSSGLVQHLFDGRAPRDPKGEHLDVNPALCAMTGFSREELVGVGPPHPYWPPEDNAAMRKEFTRDLTGHTRPTALTFMRENGERFPVMVAHSRVRDERGAVTAMMATIKDMSELMAAQAELADSERRFRRTFDQAPVGAAIVTLDGHFQRVNAAFRRMTGYSEDELTTMTFLDITLPEEREHDAELVAQLLRGDNDELVREKRYVRKDGSEIWGLLSARVARDDAGEPLYFLPMIVDVDDRRRAQEALRERGERYRSVVEASHEGIVLQAPDGRLLTWNAAAERVFGISKRGALGATSTSRDRGTIHEDGSEWPTAEHPSLHTLATGEAAENAVMGVKRDGDVTWILVNTAPMWAPGEEEPYAVVISFADITERKQAEEALQEGEKSLREAQRLAHIGNWQWTVATD